MSNRNFILLIIVLTIITFGVIYYFVSYRPAQPEDAGDGTNFLSDFSPFGGTTVQQKPTEEPSYNTPQEIGETTGKLKKVSNLPVAGYGVFQKERYKEVPPPTEGTTTSTTKKPTPPPTEFAAAIRYVARSDGNIYQTFADKIYERKFSSTVIPKVYEAYFGNKAQSVAMRNLEADEITLATFIGSLPKEVLGQDVSTNEVRGYFLPPNIKDISLSPDQTKVLYLAPVNGGVSGMSLSFLDGKKSLAFDSAFTEWLPQWPNAKMITLTSKPSAFVPGFMYSVDPATKKFSRVLGEINGLTTLTSPNGKFVAYSGNDLSLQLYEVGPKSTRALGVRTLPEKCVWDSGSIILYCAAPETIIGALYPDAWYKGEISFSDQIWKIDTATGTTEIILDPLLAGGENTDGTKLGLDENEDYLFFINKKDSKLWELELN